MNRLELRCVEMDTHSTLTVDELPWLWALSGLCGLLVAGRRNVPKYLDWKPHPSATQGMDCRPAKWQTRSDLWYNVTYCTCRRTLLVASRLIAFSILSAIGVITSLFMGERTGVAIMFVLAGFRDAID